MTSSNVSNHQAPASQSKTELKNLVKANNELKASLETLESYILGTSETINEKIEEIMRQMVDLHVEIKSNIDLVQEKKRVKAADTVQFIRVLSEDVRQFITCMNDDLTQVYQAIEERDVKCKLDLRGLEATVLANDSLKQDL